MKPLDKLINTLGIAVVIGKYLAILFMAAIALSTGAFAAEYLTMGLANNE